MQLSNLPLKLTLPFANAGTKNTIPAASQIGITAGAASLADGFPPLTRTPIASGGVPPSGADMNGILFEMSAAIRWANAGGGYAFDGTFAADAAVGGYPKGARVMRSDGEGYWLNTAENNTTDPEAAGAGWVPDFTSGAATVAMASANVTLTALQAGRPLIIITGTLTANLNLIFPTYVKSWLVLNRASGAYNVTCKTSGGTGLAVPTGTRAQIVGDGTNVEGVILDSSSDAATVGAFSNLKASATGTSASIAVTVDEIVVESASNAYKTLRAVSLTVAGTSVGVNALDAGTIATSTWYSLWVIWNGSTTAGLLSLSATAPTLPAGYTHKARVGWIRTDSSGNKYPLSFKQSGNAVTYVIAAGSNVPTVPAAISGVQGNPNTPTWVSASLVNFVPPTASQVDVILVCSSGSSSSPTSIVAPNNAYGTYSSTNPPQIGTSSLGPSTQTVSKLIMLQSMAIFYAASGVDNGSGAYINGWEDTL